MEARQAKFEVYEDSAGEWRWRGIAGNGEIIADSGEGYATKANAERARDRAIELAWDWRSPATNPQKHRD